MRRDAERRGAAYTEAKPPPGTLGLMSYAIVEDVAASWESYAPYAAAFEGRPPEGLIVHAAGPTDEGFRIIQVWSSEEAWRRFSQAFRRPTDARLAAAPCYLRGLEPAHVVIGREPR